MVAHSSQAVHKHPLQQRTTTTPNHTRVNHLQKAGGRILKYELQVLECFEVKGGHHHAAVCFPRLTLARYQAVAQHITASKGGWYDSEQSAL